MEPVPPRTLLCPRNRYLPILRIVRISFILEHWVFLSFTSGGPMAMGYFPTVLISWRFFFHSHTLSDYFYYYNF